MELQSLKNSNNDNNEFNNNNNNSNDDLVFKPMIKGEKRNLVFKVTTFGWCRKFCKRGVDYVLQ